MNNELGSTYSKLMIDQLLHVHACTNMYRSSGNVEYKQTALGWMEGLKKLMESLERELRK